MARRGTTPDYELKIHGRDLTECRSVVTIKQSGKMIDLEGNRLTVSYDVDTDITTISFRLTQEETLGMSRGSAEVQVRFVDSNEYADATDIGSIKILPILNEEVITYGDHS